MTSEVDLTEELIQLFELFAKEINEIQEACAKELSEGKNET